MNDLNLETDLNQLLEAGILEHGLLLWLANSRFGLTLVMFW